jgi:hypothetical protein
MSGEYQSMINCELQKIHVTLGWWVESIRVINCELQKIHVTLEWWVESMLIMLWYSPLITRGLHVSSVAHSWSCSDTLHSSPEGYMYLWRVSEHDQLWATEDTCNPRVMNGEYQSMINCELQKIHVDHALIFSTHHSRVTCIFCSSQLIMLWYSPLITWGLHVSSVAHSWSCSDTLHSSLEGYMYLL